MLHIDKIRSMQEYLATLKEDAGIYVDNTRLEQAIEDCTWEMAKYKELATMWLKIESAGRYNMLTKDTIIDFLFDLGVDLDKRFRNRKTDNISLDMQKVVEPLIEAGIAVDVLSNYKLFRSFSTYLSFLRGMRIDRVIYSRKTNGAPVIKYNTNIVEKENLRVYYNKLAVVSIPKIYSSIITGKSDDYYIAWCDYPQADWRFAYNLFIKDDTNKQIMAECKDSYEGLARLVEADNFSEDNFKEKRTEYKVNCLKVFYNSSDNREVPTAIRKYFRSRKKYKKLIDSLYTLQKFGLPIKCTSYFGHETYLPAQQIPASFISKGMNTPIQTFTSEIVIETICRLLERFWSLGYTKDDINVYFVRHDEPIFMFKKTILKDAWVFRDCSEIHIDGFTPIHLDFFFGSYYKEVDNKLTKEIEDICNQNLDKIHQYPMGEMKEYFPFPSVNHLSVDVRAEADIYIFNFFDYITCQRRTVEVDKKDTIDLDISEILLFTIETRLDDWLNRPEYLLVNCSGIEGIFKLWGTTLVKVVDNYDSNAFCDMR